MELDLPSKHSSKMLAILDMQMGMVGNKVQYKFYRKPMANQYTNSAVSDRVKRSTMTNEALRPPVQKKTKKNVHEEPYFRSLSVSNHPPSQACSEAHKVILNLPSP